LKQLASIPVARKTTVSKYLAGIGRKGGKASGKARMEKLTPEQRVAVAKKAAAARWAKPVTQGDLKRQSASQVAEWTADRVAQMGAEKINSRIAGGATVKPGKLMFDKKLKMATAKNAPARPSVPVVAAKKGKTQPRRRKPIP
jgi:predicted ABC-class ATPase